jgi:hypothetical protein
LFIWSVIASTNHQDTHKQKFCKVHLSISTGTGPGPPSTRYTL